MFTKKQHQNPKSLTAKKIQHNVFSSHHLECNNYALHEEIVHGSNVSHLDENIPFLKKSEECEICKAMDAIDFIKNAQTNKLKARSTGKEVKRNRILRKIWETMKKKESTEKNGDVTFESKDFVTMLELYNVHRDLFVKIPKDPKFSLEKFAKDLHSTSSGRPFVKSGSFSTDISSRNAQPSKQNHGWIANFNSMNKEVKHNAEETPITSEEKNNGLQASSSLFATTVNTQRSESGVETSHVTDPSSETSNNDSDQHKHQKVDEIALNRIRDFFEDIINATKEQNRISKDAVMHKIPYGQKISEDDIPPTLFRSTSDRSYNDSLRFKPNAPSIRYHDRSMRRSRSLSDSLDRYSNLLASITTKESKRLPETSSSTNDDSFQDETNPPPLESTSTLEKISKQSQHEVYEQSAPSVASPTIPRGWKRELEDHSSAYQKSVDTLGSGEKVMSGTTERRTSDGTNESVVNEHKEQSFLTCEIEQNEKCQTIVKTEYQGHVRMHTQMAADLKNLLLDNEIQQSESPNSLDSAKAGNKQTMPEHKDGFRFETDEEPSKPSPISVLDSTVEEEFSPRSLNPQLNLLNIPPRKLDFDVSNMLEDTEITIANQHAVSSKNIRTFTAKEDYEAEFNYVSNIVKKFNFNGANFVGAGSSVDKAEHLIIGELYGLTSQCSITSLDSDDTEIYHLLLADLVNEILSEIYKNSAAHMWLSRYGSHCRPFPVGSYLLEEVWDKISKILISRTQTIHTVDKILALDFAKKDIWPNLQLSAESLSTEVADLILDHMLEELILEFDDE